MDFNFISSITKLHTSLTATRGTSDFADCFSHSFTNTLLILFTVITSVRNYFGQTISCWLPTSFTKLQQDFAEQVCWINNTYFIPTQADMFPVNPTDRYKAKIGYYQWIPFILLFQAFLFSFPKIIWIMLQWQSGIHLSSILSVSCELPEIKDVQVYKQNVRYIAKHIEDTIKMHLKSNSQVQSSCKSLSALMCGTRSGNYLISLYLIVKFLYVANVIGQILMMNRYLHSKYRFYGFQLLKDLVNGITWEESGSFPRITWCDFTIWVVGHQKHTHTTQCVLPVNMFNEKIYILLWFWYILVAIVAVGSFLTWVWRASFKHNRVNFIRKHLKIRGLTKSSEKKSIRTFVDLFMSQDAIFILRLISHNASDMICSQVVEQLWCIFKDKPYSLSVTSEGCVRSNECKTTSSGSSTTVPSSRKEDVKFRHTTRDNAALSDPGETI